jgi:serine protease
VTGLSATSGNWLHYTINVPAGASNLNLTSSGGSGDADMYVRFGSQPTTSAYDCRPYRSGNAETCSFATPQAGTYHVSLRAYSTFSGVSLVGSYGAGGGGGSQTYSNGTDYAIPDNNATGIRSPITVSGRSGNAGSSVPVAVNIVHTYRGDLVVDLLAPDGSVYNLSNRSGGSADNINSTYTLNLSSEPLNGTWNLRASDRAGADTGYINSWSITF